MGCARSKARRYSEGGPFVVNGRGEFCALTGEPLAPGQKATVAPGTAGAGESGPGRRPGPALGTRPETPWTPPGRPGGAAPAAAGRSPLGTRLTKGAVGRSGAWAGRIATDGADTGPSPIGALPSVPALPGVDLERIARAAIPGAEPYGLAPLALTEAQVYGEGALPFSEPGVVVAPGTEGGLRRVEPYRQYVPPPPAPQDVCLVNGFDPRWGTPPGEWRGVVMRFEPTLGAYGFDAASIPVREAFLRTGDTRLRDWYEEVASRYRTGFMLQPYPTDDGSGQWAFRWIPRRQEVVCV